MSLIATDGLESALREILEQLRRQAADIANLRGDVANCVTKTDILAIERSFTARISAVERQVEQIERDTAVDVPLEALEAALDGGTTAGDPDDLARSQRSSSVVGATAGQGVARVPISRYIGAHHGHIRALQQHAALAATASALEDVRSEATMALNSALERVGDERAARGTVEQLGATADALAAQINAMQGMLHTKVDRSDMVKLQATAAELSTFASWKTTAASSLIDLDGRLSTTRTAVDRSLESVVKLSSTVQALAATAASKADAKDLVSLQGAVERLGSDVRTRATESSLRDTQSSVAAVAGRTSVLEGGLKDSARQAGEDKRAVEGRIASTASALRSETSAVVETLKRDLSRLQDEVDARAYVTAVEATDESVCRLGGSVDVLDRKVAVALRFIDWYAEKGEVYDVNASAMERHMNALAVGNRARTAESMGMGDMRARVYGADATASLRAAYTPLPVGKAGTYGDQSRSDGGSVSAQGGSPGSAAAATSAGTADVRITGTAGVRMGGIAQ